nr:MAG TPA: hypothetical protein [Caudoviricetes sp.]
MQKVLRTYAILTFLPGLIISGVPVIFSPPFA